MEAFICDASARRSADTAARSRRFAPTTSPPRRSRAHRAQPGARPGADRRRRLRLRQPGGRRQPQRRADGARCSPGCRSTSPASRLTGCAARGSTRSRSRRARSRPARPTSSIAGGVEIDDRARRSSCPRPRRRVLAQRRDLRHDDRLAVRQSADEGALRRRFDGRDGRERRRRVRRLARRPGRVRAALASARRRGADERATSTTRSSPVDDPAPQGRAGRRRQRRAPARGHDARGARRNCPARSATGGTVTAGNASGVNDGARGADDRLARRGRGARPHADRAGLSAARRRASSRASWASGPCRRAEGARAGGSRSTVSDFDVIELNEAFAAQALAVLRELGLADDAAHVNPNGGAIALGHPLGASGARLAATAAHRACAARGGRYALAHDVHRRRAGYRCRAGTYVGWWTPRGTPRRPARPMRGTRWPTCSPAAAAAACTN